MHQLTKQRLFGILEIVLGLLWIWRNADIIYWYRAYPEILHAFMIPEWILILETVIGLTGTYFGWLVYKEKWSILKGYLWFAAIWLIGFTIEMITVMF